jgi:hypothetical protein
MSVERNMSDKKRTTVTTIETHEVWIIRRATVPELRDESALTTGVDTTQVIKLRNATTSDPAIDATPTDAATAGNQFRLTDAATGDGHFNLATTSLSKGVWQITARLSDGSTHTAFIELK